MGNILCLLIGSALTVLLLASMVRRGLRPMAAASAYRNAAWRLGVEADTLGLSMQGYIDRRRLFIGQLVRPGGRHKHVTAVLDLDIPLGLGLRIRGKERGWRDRAFRRGKRKGVTVVDPEIDGALEIRAFEPDRARALLTDASREVLVRLLSYGMHLEVTDHWIQMRLDHTPRRERELLDLVADLRQLAEALESARKALPRPEQMDVWVEPWRHLASEHGLEFNEQLPSLEGEIDGTKVRVLCIRGTDGFQAEVRAEFPPHRPLGLRIEPQTRPDGFWNVGQDIQFADPAFDQAFVIKGYAPPTIRGLVTPEARAVLLELTSLGRVVLTDPWIDVLEVKPNPEQLEAALTRCIRLAHALDWTTPR